MTDIDWDALWTSGRPQRSDTDPDTLVTRLRPNLARSMHQPDPVTYVYKLRHGVKFWDGSPLTAADVVYSMNKHLDPKAASELASYYASVKWIRATAPDEVTIKLKAPDATFQYVPGFFAALVVKQQFWQDHLKDIGTAGVLTMGTPLPLPKYEKVATREVFYHRVLTEISALPGVSGAAYVSFAPLTMRGGIWPVSMALVTRPWNAGGTPRCFICATRLTFSCE